MHNAKTKALRLDNRQYVYETRDGDDVLLVALNIDDKPLRIRLTELGAPQGQVVAGSSAPPPETLDAVVVEPHGWRILSPA